MSEYFHSENDLSRKKMHFENFQCANMAHMRELTDQEQKLVIERLIEEWRRLGCSTQKEFAAAIGLSPGYTNLILSGKRLGIRSLNRIAKKLNKPVDFFLSQKITEQNSGYISKEIFDEALLKVIMEKTFKIIDTKKKKLSSAQLSTLFSKLYTHYNDTGETPSNDEIEKYLLLINCN